MTESVEYIVVDGKKLEIVRYGPPPEEAPTLVFLHEGLGCVDMWFDFPEQLATATGYGALVYSRSGYGRSDPCAHHRPIRFMHHEGLTVLPELLDKAGIRDYILIGHSDGGSIAIVYAGGTKAAKLRGLITEAAHVFCEDLSVQSIRAAKDAYLRSDLRARLKKYHGRNVDCAFWGWNHVWLHPDFMQWNIEEYLPGIKVPMLAIQGEDDQYGTAAQLDAIVRQVHSPCDRLMLKACRHAPHNEQKEKTLNAMIAFVLRTLH